jgi:hypothetical protein
MLPLDVSAVPTTAQGWRDAISSCLRRWVEEPPLVRLDGDLPALDVARIQINGNCPTPLYKPDVTIVGPTTPGPTVARLDISVHPLALHDVPLFCDVSARSVALATGRNAGGQLLLTVAHVADGQASAAIAARDLDVALLAAARAGAAPHGVEILAVKSQLTAQGPRDLDVAVDLTAKKFMKFTVRVTGHLSVDDALVATATQLKVEGSGMAAGFAAGILRSQLMKLEGQRVPLMQFNLGAVQLRDVAVDTNDGLSISASFGGKL